MSKKAKILETNRDWESIDIYLFSNGQQFSPPRKYHLRSEELKWWKATLMNLARLHYGSLHSCIELYTLEGVQVDGPLELINGNAYVAVEPPDLFINSKYSEYIMKASRSWEKRLARRTNSNEITKSDESKIRVRESKLDNDSEVITIRNKNEKVTADMIQIPVHESIITRPITNIDIDPSNKNSPLLKTAEIIRPPFSPNPQMTRKLPGSSKKRFSIKKYHSQKEPCKIQNLLENETVSGDEKVPITKKVISTSNKLKTPFSVSSKIKPFNSKGSTGMIKSINKISTNYNVKTNNKIFKNTDIALPSIIVSLEGNSNKVKLNEKQTLSDIMEKCDISQPIIDRKENNSHKEPIPINNDNFKTSDKMVFKSTQCDPNVTFSNKIANNNNYIIVNKGEIVNLKLHIEVDKETGGTNYNNKLNFKRSRSFTNYYKTDKACQINPEDELFVQNELLYSLLIPECNQNINACENSKFIIVKCDYCLYCDSYELNAFFAQNINKKYVVLMPTATCTEEIQRCQCEQDNDKVKTIAENKKEARLSSVCNPIKETFSDFSLQRLTKKDPEVLIKLIDPETSKLENRSSDAQNQELNDYAVNRSDEVLNEVEIISEYIVENNHSENEGSETSKLVITRKATDKLPKSFVDKSIQTESSNILLQVRRQDDGHYTFHFPPLHVLKYYKIS